VYSDTEEAEGACARVKLSQNLRTVIIGAGAAGIAAAAELRRLEDNPDIVIIEARDRIGGRVNTVLLSGTSGDVSVDSGGMWLEQFDNNPLVSIAQEAGLTLLPTDFHRPLREYFYVFLLISNDAHVDVIGVTSDNVILNNRSVDDMLDRYNFLILCAYTANVSMQVTHTTTLQNSCRD
jgi:monoamine oxidase